MTVAPTTIRFLIQSQQTRIVALTITIVAVTTVIIVVIIHIFALIEIVTTKIVFA